MKPAIKVYKHEGGEGYRPMELVQYFFPRIGADEADFIIWNATAYPFNGAEGLRDQLAELAAEVRPRKRGWRRRLYHHMRRIEETMFAALPADPPRRPGQEEPR